MYGLSFVIISWDRLLIIALSNRSAAGHNEGLISDNTLDGANFGGVASPACDARSRTLVPGVSHTLGPSFCLVF